MAAGDSLGNNIMLFEHPVIDLPLIPQLPSPKRYHQKVARPKTLDDALGACALKRLLAFRGGCDRGPAQEALATQGQGCTGCSDWNTLEGVGLDGSVCKVLLSGHCLESRPEHLHTSSSSTWYHSRLDRTVVLGLAGLWSILAYFVQWYWPGTMSLDTTVLYCRLPKIAPVKTAVEVLHSSGPYPLASPCIDDAHAIVCPV